MTKKYVIAFNGGQYVDWLKQKKYDKSEWIYVFDAELLRGVRNPHGVFIGTWDQRKDIYQIVQRIVLATDSGEMSPGLSRIWAELNF